MTILSNPHKFLFIHIPKCGGTSIENTWEPIVQWGDFVIGSTDNGERIQYPFKNLYGLYKHNTALEVRDIIGIETFNKFRKAAVIRNPLNIVESFYRYSKTILRNIVMREIHQNNLTLNNYSAVETNTLAKIGNSNTTGLPLWIFQNDSTNRIIRQAILSEDFSRFINVAIDLQVGKILSSYLCDDDQNLIVDDIVKLEDVDSINSYFNRYIAECKLPKLNKSNDIIINWPNNLKDDFIDQCYSDLKIFGYLK